MKINIELGSLKFGLRHAKSFRPLVSHSCDRAALEQTMLVGDWSGIAEQSRLRRLKRLVAISGRARKNTLTLAGYSLVDICTWISQSHTPYIDIPFYSPTALWGQLRMFCVVGQGTCFVLKARCFRVSYAKSDRRRLIPCRIPLDCYGAAHARP